jgi:hypothetical protein
MLKKVCNAIMATRDCQLKVVRLNLSRAMSSLYCRALAALDNGGDTGYKDRRTTSTWSIKLVVRVRCPINARTGSRAEFLLHDAMS